MTTPHDSKHDKHDKHDDKHDKTGETKGAAPLDSSDPRSAPVGAPVARPDPNHPYPTDQPAPKDEE